MRYEGNKVVISEAEIRYLVKESVKNYLRENAEDELLGGLGSIFGSARQNMSNVGHNMANTYRQGNYNTQVQRQGNACLKALRNFSETATQANIPELKNNITRAYELIKQAMEQSKEQLADVQSRTFSTNRY